MKTTLLLGCWLLAAGPVIARASEITEPAPIELKMGEEQTLDLPGAEEILVASAEGIEVTQLSESRAIVRAVRPDGRAVLLVRLASGYQTLVVRTSAGPRADAHAPPAVPIDGSDLALGGDYYATGAPEFAHASLYHWASWAQPTPVVDIDGFVGVLGQTRGAWGVSDLRLAASAKRWDALVGDFDLQLVGAVEGFAGSSASLRGIEGSVRPTAAPFRVGVLAAAHRDPSCCTYFDPERMWLGGVTAGWYSGDRLWVDVIGAVFGQRDGSPQPLARLRGGVRTDRVYVEAIVNQSGPGTAASTVARVQATKTLAWYGTVGGSTGNYVRPASTIQLPAQAGGNTGLSWQGNKGRVDAAFFGWGRAGDNPSRVLGGRADAAWAPTRAVSLSAGYRRTSYANAGDVIDSDTFTAGTWVRPAPPLSLDASVYATIGRELEPAFGAFGGAQVRMSPSWDTRATYRYQTLGGGEVLQGGTVGTYHHSEAVTWNLEGRADWRTTDGDNTTFASIMTTTSFRVRRWLAFGVGGYVGSTVPLDRMSWGVNAFWMLRPTALPRSAGGLGLRGRLAGDVYLDENSNGLRDEGEDGLPDMTVSIGDGRQVTTDADGRFSVRNLPAGDYPVTFNRGGYHAMGPTVQKVEVTPLRTAEADLGLTWGASINGLLYVDVHGDERFDNGDPGVTAEYVILRDEKGIVVRSGAANQGRFTFDGLAPGIYVVEVDPFGLPGGYRPVDALDQEVMIDEGRAYPVRIRFDPARAIGGVVWEDIDRDARGDGKRDLGIGGAEVYLSTGEVTRTGPDGSFLFRDLPPGAYAVRTELATEARVVVLPVEPKDVLDLSFVLPRGTRPPERNVAVEPKAPDSVAGLVLDAPMTVLPQGVALQVTATAVLSNGETREVTTRANWTSSDTGVLVVGADGRVRGLMSGTAGVGAEWKGGVGDPLTFEVLGSPLDRITVSPVGLRLNPGNTADLRVDVVDRSGRGGTVTPVAVWAVADPKVARVDADGRLKALRDGITTVQARIGDAWSPPLEVQVITAEVTALSIENLPARMPEGATVQLKATGYDTRLEVQNVTESVTWASSDPAVVRVEPDGRIIAVGRGTAQITASIGSLFTRSRTVFVTNTPPLALAVVPPGMTLSLYDLQQLRVTATFEDGSKGAVTTVVEWIVDGRAALVRPDGVVVPREPGTVRIRARYLGVESEPVTVTVEAR